MTIQLVTPETKIQKDKSLNRMIDRRLIYFGRWALLVEAVLLLAAVIDGLLAAMPIVFAVTLALGLALLSLLQGYQILRFHALHGAGPGRWRNQYLAVSLAQSAWVGLCSAAVILSTGTGLALLVAAFFLVCFANAAVDSYAPFRRAFTALIALTMVPPILAYLVLAEPTGLLLAAGLGLFTAMTIRHGRKAGANFWQRHEANFLLRQKLTNLQAEKKIDESNLQLNNDFLDNLGQELKTSLNEILGGVALLKESKPNEVQRELLGVAEKAGEKQLELVNNVIDFSRISRKELVLDSAIFNLRRELEDLFTELAGDAENQNVELNYTIDHDLPHRAKGDAGRVKQILRSLVSNVIRFSERGEIFIRVHFEPGSPEHGKLKVAVVDEGTGKIETDQRSLFNAFARIRQTRAGTGLGLAICRGIAECMNGAVGVYSEPGKGRQFWFTLPLEVKGPNRLYFAPNIKLKQLKILLVNPPRQIEWHLHEELESWGLIVSRVDGARQVMEHLLAQPKKYSAVLMFTSRKNPFIWDSAREISEHETLARLPLFLAANNREVKTHVTRQFILLHPSICVVQKPLQYKLFHQLLVQELFHLDFNQRTLPRRETPESENSGGRILLVEDHRVNQMVAEGMLKKLGYRPRIANNGKEALEMLAEEEFDLILMDCQMAEMDGYTATEQIRLRENHARADQRIPIIALTAHTAEEDRSRCLAVGMDDYLAKPVRYGDLETRLQHWLGSKQSSHHH